MSRSLLEYRQYGFQSNRSTGDSMTYFTHRIGRGIQGYGESQLLSLDIAKAFDRLSHKALLSKSCLLGFRLL